MPAQQAMSDPKPEVAPRPKATAGIDPVVRQKVQAAKTTLGMKDVNVSAALAAHQRLNDLAAKNPNVPTTRLMGRLSSNQAKSYSALASRVPPSQLSSGIPLTKFRNTLRVIKTADQAAAAAEKAANESVELLDKEQVSEMLTGGNEQNPPAMIVLRRRGIRIFPDGRRVALYDNKQLGLAVTIPYKGSFAPEVIPNVTTEGFDDYEQIAKELVKKHGKNVTMDHIDDLEKERDSRSSLDKDEVMQHVKKLTVEGYKFKGGFPFDVDHIPGAVHHNADMTTDNIKTKDKAHWHRAVNSINTKVHDDNSEFSTDSKGGTVTGKGAVWAKWDNATKTGWFNAKGRPLKTQEMKEEAQQVVENLDALAKIAKSNKPGKIKFKDGSSSDVHPQVAGIIHQLHGALNDENKKKVERMIGHSAGQFDKIADFAVSKSQWTINNK